MKVSMDTHNPITFVTTFSREYDSIKDIISKYFPVLYADSDLAPILSAGCRFPRSRSQTLGNILSPRLFSSSGHNKTWLYVQGSYICGTNICHFCNIHSSKHKTIVSRATGKEFTIRSYIHCGSSNVVNAIECTLYKLQYVGYTTRPVRTKISKHYHGASYASDKCLSNVSKHFKHNHAGNVDSFKKIFVWRKFLPEGVKSTGSSLKGRSGGSLTSIQEFPQA